MKMIKLIALILVLVGALNWGLIGMFRFNLVTFLFGEWTLFTRLVYCLVGISAIITLPLLARIDD